MESLFSLKQDSSQLMDANQGISRMTYDQETPTRDVTTTNFPNGAIHIRWQVSGQKWWVPSRSYLRLRCKLSKVGGAQLTKADGIAPNMGLGSSLFQGAEFRINDKPVSKIGNFMPQIDALETRLHKSRAWLGGVGNSTNFWDNDISARISDVASDGIVASKTDELSLVTRVLLGFDPTTTVAYTDATQLLTFATGTIPDVRVLFPPGSQIRFTAALGGAPAGSVFVVQSAPSATTLTITYNLIGGDIAAATRNFSKVVPGVVGRAVDEFEVIWTPPLSIFKVAHAMPCGKYELILTPQSASNYQSYAIESLTNKSYTTDYNFTVNSMIMYINTVEGPRADDMTYLLDLQETSCQSARITTTAFHQKTFDVLPSTTALTVAYQDLRAGSDTRVSSSKFKSYNVAIDSPEETKLSRFNINYAGSTLPSPDSEPTFTARIDYTLQQYIDTQLYSGSIFDNGGSESLQEFRSRGAYYHYAIPKDGTDRSTSVAVNQQFTGANVDNMMVLLFSHSRKVARIQIKDGNITDLQTMDI